MPGGGGGGLIGPKSSGNFTYYYPQYYSTFISLLITSGVMANNLLDNNIRQGLVGVPKHRERMHY